MIKKKLTRWIIGCCLFIFILMNVVAFFHAYKFTHFAASSLVKTKDAKELSSTDKLKALLFGVNNPRPVNTRTPQQAYEIVRIQANKVIEGWSIKADNAKGTVIIFHGYSGQKSSMLDKADVFLKLGYNTLLIDFMGSGGSEGNQTTIGFKEAEQVKASFDYLAQHGEKETYLFGTSLGAVAILKAIHDYQLKPKGIIIECPFGSMYQTTCARFNAMKVPAFPMAGLLVFWGGVQNGFWAFGHNPTTYAKEVNCPALLLYGEKDDKVSRKEIDEIYANLKGVKELKIYPLAGHENYLLKYRQQWAEDVAQFLRKTSVEQEVFTTNAIK